MKEIELGHLKTYKMKLTTLSPVFIGGGDTILGLKTEEDFKNKVLKNNPSLMKEWIYYFTYFNDIKHNENPNIRKKIPKDAKAPSLQGFLRYIDNKEFKPNKQSNKFVRTSGNPYIPGSSIKGAIETALLSYLIFQGKDIKEAQKFLKEQMEYIQISDSTPISEDNFEEMKIYPQKIIQDKCVGYSPDKNGMPKKLFPKEFLYEDVEVEFYITIDTKRFKYSLLDILNLSKWHYNNIYEENKKSLIGTKINVCLDDLGLNPNINIGGQSGFNTKVVLRSMAKDFQGYIQLKKQKLSQNFKYHNHEKLPVAPRYLKFIKAEYEDGNEYFTIGWCNISQAE